MSIYFIDILRSMFATFILTTASLFGGNVNESKVSIVNE